MALTLIASETWHAIYTHNGCVTCVTTLTTCTLKARVQIGLYKRSLVVIKRIYKRSIDLKRNILKELNAVRVEI